MTHSPIFWILNLKLESDPNIFLIHFLLQCEISYKYHFKLSKYPFFTQTNFDFDMWLPSPITISTATYYVPSSRILSGSSSSCSGVIGSKDLKRMGWAKQKDLSVMFSPWFSIWLVPLRFCCTQSLHLEFQSSWIKYFIKFVSLDLTWIYIYTQVIELR